LNKKEIIICTLGTHGDILPFLPFAKAWVTQGYNVTILSNIGWKKIATETGASFHSIAPDDPPQSNRDNFRFFLENIMPSYRASFDFIARRVATGERPILFYRNNMLGPECAAEVFDLPNAKVVLQPSGIQSKHRPPWPWTLLASGRWRWLYNAVIFPLLMVIGAIGRYRRATNRFRKEVGAKPIPFKNTRLDDTLTLLLCPQWYASPQPDWPPNTHCIGFPDKQNEVEDTTLRDFIAQYGKPIVFTPGTGVSDVSGFLNLARSICGALNLPGIFLSRHAHLQSVESGTFIVRKYADLGWLARRSRLLVHHGGIGTTSEALRAGIPQVILPDKFDQPDNAMRIAGLGLGGVIMNIEIGNQHWTKLIEKLLSDDRLHDRLNKVANAIAQDRCVERGLNLVAARAGI